MMLSRRLCAEALGTGALLAVVVGSGAMGWRLAEGNAAIALLANSLATGYGLFVLISIFGPVSGAHFNPLVTAIALIRGDIGRGVFVAYLLVQLAGAVVGVWLAHAMFAIPILDIGSQHRAGVAQWLSEFIASAGLVLVIQGTRDRRIEIVGAVVGAYIAAAYWFTASTSFANPAVTLARSFTSTFAGISPLDVAGFVVAQTLGAGVAYLVAQHLWPRHAPEVSTDMGAGARSSSSTAAGQAEGAPTP
jgi:glycerol uptake facilitator-like aquaporin